MTARQEQQLEQRRQQLQKDLRNAMLIYQQYKKSVQSYENIMLPNAAVSMQAASDKFSAGEIGFIDWMILVNQAMQVRSNYFDVIERMNAAAFEIEKIAAIP